jgi:hypothetical protein
MYYFGGRSNEKHEKWLMLLRQNHRAGTTGVVVRAATDGKRVEPGRWKEVRGEGVGKKRGKSTRTFYEYATEVDRGRRARASASFATPLLTNGEKVKR